MGFPTPQKYSNTEIKPASLLGVYNGVWDSHTGYEISNDIGEEEFWIKLSIKSPENVENPSFADIEGRFRWWRKIGSFKGLIRAKDLKENLWLVNGVTWSALVDIDDDEGKHPWESDAHYEALTRATNDFGLACLVTLDSAGNPFLEMLYNTGKSKDPSSPDYVRVIWKKQKEGCRTNFMLSDGESQRLMRDGAADLSDTRVLRDDNEDAEDAEDQEVDAEGDLDEELELQNVNVSQTDLKRRAGAGEDDECPGAKRYKR